MSVQPDLRNLLMTYVDDLRERVTTETGDWTVKGFIDIYQRIYTISLDTKVLSKVLELLMFPVITKFANENNFRIELARQQNQYPDLTLISSDGVYHAVDIKSTYRKGIDKQGRVKVNGMTLGTYSGYFRIRDKAVISTYPYNQYSKHYVLGVIYTQVRGIDESKVYAISDLTSIPSVAKDFSFFMHEKYRIASDRPGSGNTRNIGSSLFLERLMNGSGVFAELGVEIFDDYWMNYRTNMMARSEGFEQPPYRNLIEYKRHKEQGASILEIDESRIQSEAVDEDTSLDEFPT